MMLCCLVFTQGRLCVHFRCSVVDPLRVVGFSDAPGKMRGSGGRCVKFSTTRQALGRFLLLSRAVSFRLGCTAVCSEIFTMAQAVCRFWQAVHRMSPHKESFL
ncbi:hypothetical protein NDU88_001791 [Pleurodeles waltl]|uniref:Secreted protein n=1 Tax=Pleurodeles waltl TaxID=8319 RepID=A0AAV7WN25_PLEWA|nr:hypothetical protein NDU88_001791 [Pleurodeles waltl]